ncbi:hypothetical protein EV360DRAFT_49183 [Lentinula raphanica]|nr:hypothetical protein EV360DRAFT_49183 [Lentinula raphanica]
MHAESGPGPIHRLQSSPERFRADSSGSGFLDRVPEDGAVEFDGRDEGEEEDDIDDDAVDEDLESQGLYRGSYRRLLVLYTFVPLTFAILFALLAILPTWAYPLQVVPDFPSVLPFPLTELFVSAGLWCLSHMLRTPIYGLSLLICTSCRLSHYSFPALLSTLLHSIVSLLLRVIAIPILLIPHYLVYETPTWRDPAFRRVWWVALGWAAVEAIVAIKQGYQNIMLYRDVLVNDTHDEERVGGASPVNILPHDSLAVAPAPAAESSTERAPLLQRHSRDSNVDLEASLELQVEEDVDQLIAVRKRDELEKYYGIPFVRIPAFIPCLQRANALLFSLGMTLILSSAYLKGAIVHSWFMSPHIHPAEEPPAVYIIPSESTPDAQSNQLLTIGVPVVFIVQMSLSILHSQLVLPKAGVHTVVYIGSLVSLGIFFAGLSVWDALS